MNKLLDNFGRIHDYLRISLTDTCNLRCFYCMSDKDLHFIPQKKLLTTKEIIKLVEDFVNLGVKTVRLTGGEPLIRKDFSTLLEALHEFPITVKLTTNGVLLPKYVDELKKFGVQNINISIDSLLPEKFKQITKRDRFEQVINAIHLANKEGFDLKLNVVLIRGVNDDEIIPFIQWVADKNIAVKFIEFMPFKGNKWDLQKGIRKQEILDIATKKFGKIQEEAPEKHATTTYYSIPGFLGKFGIISTITEPFCYGCNRIRLTADGKMKNCLFSTEELDLRTALRNGEEIQPLIQEHLQRKKASRNGMSQQIEIVEAEKNRSMNSIGG